MKLVVGLGNPGKEYEKTNHNIGFRVVDRVVNELGGSFEKKEVCKSIISVFGVGEKKVVFAKPQTYMNNSGFSVIELVKKYNIDTATELIVISDDFDIAEGTIRIRNKSGNSTHNGIRSIKQLLNTNEFIRVKVSIAPKPEFVPVADFVLSRSSGESVKLSEDKAVEAVLKIVNGEKLEKIMGEYSK